MFRAFLYIPETASGDTKFGINYMRRGTTFPAFSVGTTPGCDGHSGASTHIIWWLADVGLLGSK